MEGKRYFCDGIMKADMKYLFSLLALITLTAAAQELPTTESYVVNFDRSTARTHASRRLLLA